MTNDNTVADEAPEDVDLGEMRCVERVLTPTEAHLLKSCLVAAGIPAMVADAHLVQANSFLTNAAGGVRVMVPARLIDAAKQVLAEFHKGGLALDDDEPAPPAPRAPKDVALWHPDGAAFWSLLFTPVFGTALHLLNRRALGEPGQIAAWGWLIASLVLTLGSALFVLSAGATPAAALIAAGLSSGFAVVWYFAAGYAHSKAIAAVYGTRYRRRPFFKAWLIGLAFLGLRRVLHGAL
ncbi:DUF2007 domain-containing protein [Aquabacterium sp. A7-Y]|uniref:putative signal transducing protein n=1 Tax=Aquabacterium sp. A7-Y TaxID=1349605 RepID=UPI00223E22C4|nr:DUF2007 domain-containing protein [Aquabacterium sp. A7-Y]MCW7538633.1 DUF2007 domain-containing protein [Aquabacterium sp. A7-Y]